MSSQNSASGAYFNFLIKKDGAYIRKCYDGDPSKLKFQYEWLLRHQGLSCIPFVENPMFRWNYFSYDLKFYHDYRSFFEVIKEGDAFRCQEILEKVFKLLPLIHKDEKAVISRELLVRYIDDKFFKKIEYCENLYPILKQFNRHDKVIVNGKEIFNYPLLRQKLLEPQVIEHLAHFNETEIHGDLTVENILIGPKNEVMLLDPNNENYVSSALVDYAKFLQSLHSRYEFLCLIEEVEVKNHCINFHLEANLVYDHLLKFFLSQMRQRFFPQEREQLIFHEAMHLARLLPYRLRMNEHSFMAFYGMMLLRFNEFVEGDII